MTNNPLGVAAYRQPAWCPTHQFSIPVNIVGQSHVLMAYGWGNPDATRVLLCVHGIYQMGLMFQYLGAYLAGTHRVIAIDLPGRGLTPDVSPEAHDLTVYLDLVRQVIAFLGIQSSYDYCGTSLGGLLGYRLAADLTLGAGLKHLIVNDVAPLLPMSTLAFLREKAQLLLTPFPSLSVAMATYQLFTQTPYLSSAPVDAFLRHIMMDVFAPVQTPTQRIQWQWRVSPRVLEAGQADEEALSSFVEVPGFLGHWRDFEAIRVPCLLIQGLSSTVLTADLVEEMRARQPLCQVCTVPGAPHAPFLCTPAECDPIADFLRR